MRMLLVAILLIVATSAFYFARDSELSDQAGRREPRLGVTTAPLKDDQPASEHDGAPSAAGTTGAGTAAPAYSAEALVEREASRIGQVDPDPAGTERRLRETAQKLSMSELRRLTHVALDPKKNGDERFMAVQLLGWTENRAALPELENIATHPVPPLKDERALSFEISLRGLAIESIGAVGDHAEKITALSRVAGRVDHAFLTDRTQRVAAHLNDENVKSIEAQDREALERLLGQ